MEDYCGNEPSDLNFTQMAKTALYSGDATIKANQRIKIGDMIGRRDSLTEIQQKILIAVISLIHQSGEIDAHRTSYMLGYPEVVTLLDGNQENCRSYLINEIEKLGRKGIWLYDEVNKQLTRILWFQSIAITDREIAFQFTEGILPVILALAPTDAELQLVKGLGYKGKHTLAVFDIIWQWRNQGLMEYSIVQLMQQLSLEHTRYSYGQLKLRVLEPALEEIYAWDDAIFVRFGPTFSGRRVEGVWFEVIIGETAKQLRKEQPEFKFLSPEEKLVQVK